MKILISILLYSLAFCCENETKTIKVNNLTSKNPAIEKIEEANVFCSNNSMNTNYAIFVDMSIHSGKNRLFLVDLKEKSVINKGLCSHGCCDAGWSDDSTASNPTFSNVPDSHCSSKGKYKIGNRGWSNWGINVNYKLHGLDDTNSNAFDRVIVLHSWEQVPDYELYPSGTPEGWGCPAVSDNMMRSLDELFKTEEMPILLWIYD